MRIINVIEIKEGVVDNIESYAVLEEQLLSDVVEQAEADFTGKVLELGGEYVNLDDYIDDGYFSIMNASVCITWSDIDC